MTVQVPAKSFFGAVKKCVFGSAITGYFFYCFVFSDRFFFSASNSLAVKVVWP